ncbi:hypothetical protein, partial [Klebsiella pneumoniae]|uniref:hypothetical protein n=1 Tax=Klebsiella pneumoniae TaxID=573 RepID=UPI002ADFAAB0
FFILRITAPAMSNVVDSSVRTRLATRANAKKDLATCCGTLLRQTDHLLCILWRDQPNDLSLTFISMGTYKTLTRKLL